MKKSVVPERYIPVFCQELHQLYRSGITPADGLALLKEDEQDESVLSWLDGLCESTADGLPLAEALRESGAFPEYMTDMLSLAENTGHIEDTLPALQRHYERRIRMRDDVRSAVTVPVILLVVMIAVVVLLITQILPVFDRVFAQLGVQMGGVAAAMMNAGTVLAKAGTGIAIALAAIAVLTLAVALIPALRTRFAAWFTRRFGGRGVLGRMAVSRFASAMAMASASGMDMEESFALSAKLAGGAGEIGEKLSACQARIEEGESAADALSESGLFSNRDCRLLKLSERTGSLPETLESIAARQEEEALSRIDRLVGTIEPAIVLITSVLAGVILLSVMLPMMGLLSGIG